MIEIKLPLEVETSLGASQTIDKLKNGCKPNSLKKAPQINNNKKSSNNKIISPSKLPSSHPRDILIDMNDLDNDFDDEGAGTVLSNSGDPLLGFGGGATLLQPVNHPKTQLLPWQPQQQQQAIASRSAASVAANQRTPARGRKDRYTAGGAKAINQGQQRMLWQSDVNLMTHTATTGGNRGKFSKLLPCW